MQYKAALHSWVPVLVMNMHNELEDMDELWTRAIIIHDSEIIMSTVALMSILEKERTRLHSRGRLKLSNHSQHATWSIVWEHEAPTLKCSEPWLYTDLLHPAPPTACTIYR